MSKPRTFQKLATKAHDMEMTIANCRSKSSSSYEIKKDKGKTKKSSKPFMASVKETMVTSTEGSVRISGKPRLEEKKGTSSRDGGKKRPTLKELQEKKYPFPDSDLSGMLDDLLENGSLNSLHQSALKRPEGLQTQSTVVTIGSLAILSRDA